MISSLLWYTLFHHTELFQFQNMDQTDHSKDNGYHIHLIERITKRVVNVNPKYELDHE